MWSPEKVGHFTCLSGNHFISISLITNVLVFQSYVYVMYFVHMYHHLICQTLISDCYCVLIVTMKNPALTNSWQIIIVQIRGSNPWFRERSDRPSYNLNDNTIWFHNIMFNINIYVCCDIVLVNHAKSRKTGTISQQNAS